MSLPSIPSFVLSGLLLLCLPFSSFASATTSHITFSYAARQRMQIFLTRLQGFHHRVQRQDKDFVRHLDGHAVEDRQRQRQPKAEGRYASTTANR